MKLITTLCPSHLFCYQSLAMGDIFFAEILYQTMVLLEIVVSTLLYAACMQIRPRFHQTMVLLEIVVSTLLHAACMHIRAHD